MSSINVPQIAALSGMLNTAGGMPALLTGAPPAPNASPAPPVAPATPVVPTATPATRPASLSTPPPLPAPRSAPATTPAGGTPVALPPQPPQPPKPAAAAPTPPPAPPVPPAQPSPPAQPAAAITQPAPYTPSPVPSFSPAAPQPGTLSATGGGLPDTTAVANPIVSPVVDRGQVASPMVLPGQGTPPSSPAPQPVTPPPHTQPITSAEPSDEAQPFDEDEELPDDIDGMDGDTPPAPISTLQHPSHPLTPGPQYQPPQVLQPQYAEPPQQSACVPPPAAAVDSRGVFDLQTFIKLSYQQIENQMNMVIAELSMGVLDNPKLLDNRSNLSQILHTMRWEPQVVSSMTPQKLIEWEVVLSAVQVHVMAMEGKWRARHAFLSREASRVIRIREADLQNAKGSTVKDRENEVLTQFPDVREFWQQFQMAQAMDHFMRGAAERFAQLENGIKRAIELAKFDYTSQYQRTHA